MHGRVLTNGKMQSAGGSLFVDGLMLRSTSVQPCRYESRRVSGRDSRHPTPQPWLDRNQFTDLLSAAEDEGGDV